MIQEDAGKLQAVIFDVDGVLINSVPAVTIALDHAFAEYGFPLSDLDLDHRAHSVKLMLAEVERKRGLHIDHDTFARKLVAHILSQLEHEEADPGLHKLLGDISARGVRLALASSSTRPSVDGKLQILGIGHYFEIVVSAEDVHRHKPAPDVYLLVLSLLGTDSARCVVIEDTRPGVEAARAAGLKAVSFGKYNDDTEYDLAGDIYVQDWKQLSYRKLEALVNRSSNV
jgi:HAD superfamily hydrolase (TIGR01509 family)